jgi:integrase
MITTDHTLYSFRHTAAVNMYLKTKDPYKIQQAFGHSSLRVTLTYLRNLGLVVDASLEDLPEFPL